MDAPIIVNFLNYSNVYSQRQCLVSNIARLRLYKSYLYTNNGNFEAKRYCEKLLDGEVKSLFHVDKLIKQKVQTSFSFGDLDTADL